MERWVKGYRRVLGGLGANVGDSEYQFLRWFDFIGVQRHIKVLGVFARLWHRDGKIGYLDDLPLVMHYVLEACRLYKELFEFGRWLEWRVAPLLSAANARQKDMALRKAAEAVRRSRQRRRPVAAGKVVKRKAAKKTVVKSKARSTRSQNRKAGKRQVPRAKVVKRVAKRKTHVASPGRKQAARLEKGAPRKKAAATGRSPARVVRRATSRKPKARRKFATRIRKTGAARRAIRRTSRHKPK